MLVQRNVTYNFNRYFNDCIINLIIDKKKLVSEIICGFGHLTANLNTMPNICQNSKKMKHIFDIDQTFLAFDS